MISMPHNSVIFKFVEFSRKYGTLFVVWFNGNKKDYLQTLPNF